MIGKLIKSFVLLLSSSLLGTVIKFFITLYWIRIFSAEDFGKFSLVLSWLAVVQLISGLGISNAVSRFCQKDYSEQYQKSEILVSTYKVNIAISGGISVVVLSALILSDVKFDTLVLGISLLLINFCHQIIHTFTVYNVGQEEHALNSKVTLVNNILSALFALGIIFFRKEVSSIFVGISISYLLVGIYIWAVNFRSIWHRKVNFDYLKAALFFGLPTVFHIFATTILSVGDRTMIEMFKGIGQTGIYSGIYQVSKPLEMVILVISQIWSTNYYKEQIKNTEESQERVGIFYASYMSVMILGTSILILLSPFLVELVLPETYHQDRYLTGVICIGMLFLGFYHIAVGVLYYNRKTNLVAVSTMLAAGINILLNWLLIPNYGLFGAGLSTAIAYLVMSVVIIIAGKKFNIHFGLLMSYIPYLLVIMASGLIYYKTNNELIFLSIVAIVMGILVMKDKKYFMALYNTYISKKVMNDE